jgi:hypothetical protein
VRLLPRFASIEVEGSGYENDVVIESGRVRKRKKKRRSHTAMNSGHTPLSAEEELPWGGGPLIIGIGAYGRFGRRPIKPCPKVAACFDASDQPLLRRSGHNQEVFPILFEAHGPGPPGSRRRSQPGRRAGEYCRQLCCDRRSPNAIRFGDTRSAPAALRVTKPVRFTCCPLTAMRSGRLERPAASPLHLPAVPVPAAEAIDDVRRK